MSHMIRTEKCETSGVWKWNLEVKKRINYEL